MSELDSRLQIIPLGGLGNRENMAAIRYGDTILVIDAGLMFQKTSCWY